MTQRIRPSSLDCAGSLLEPRRVSVLENVAKWDGNMHAIAQRISNKIQNGVAAKIVFVDQVLEEVCVGEQVHTHGTELLHS